MVNRYNSDDTCTLTGAQLNEVLDTIRATQTENNKLKEVIESQYAKAKNDRITIGSLHTKCKELDVALMKSNEISSIMLRQSRGCASQLEECKRYSSLLDEKFDLIEQLNQSIENLTIENARLDRLVKYSTGQLN